MDSHKLFFHYIIILEYSIAFILVKLFMYIQESTLFCCYYLFGKRCAAGSLLFLFRYASCAGLIIFICFCTVHTRSAVPGRPNQCSISHKPLTRYLSLYLSNTSRTAVSLYAGPPCPDNCISILCPCQRTSAPPHIISGLVQPATVIIMYLTQLDTIGTIT